MQTALRRLYRISKDEKDYNEKRFCFMPKIRE